MNELRVNGTQEFLGMKIPVVEGGFGEDRKVILAKTIAEIHGVETKHVNELINKNILEFEENIDIINLKNNSRYQRPLGELGFSNRDWSISKNIYLLSEQGYMVLVMLMRTQKAKEIRRQLKKEYFTMREIIKSDEQMKAQLLMSIYNGGQEGIVASAKLTEIEKKPLLETIAIQAPRVEYAEEVLESEGTFTITQIAKEMFLSGKELNNRLNELKVQYKVNGQWVLYANHNNKGYIDTKTFIVDGHTRVSTRWTNLGREFIHNLMKKEW